MTVFPGKKAVCHFTLFISLCLLLPLAQALEVGLAGMLGSKAMLIINGSPPRTVAVGQMLDGVRLLSIQGDQAVVEIEGKKRALRVGQYAIANASEEGGGKAILNADGRGHFVVQGTVNGMSQKFLVDTGATMISLGAGDARRLGLDPAKGERGFSQTANGQAEVFRIKLDTVRVGEITMHNVDALIHSSELPVALLGMSFLNRVEMLRDGNTMTLKKRY